MSRTWSYDVIDTGRDDTLRYSVIHDARPATYSDVLEAWRSDASVREWFNGLLADVTFNAFRWETPPVTTTTLGKTFEFVVLDSPGLAGNADPSAFREHLDQQLRAEVISFSNLGGDATMVVPRELASRSVYGHVAAFVRHAPESQKHALWKVVGEAMARHINARPVWLSTAGGGVPWLHVRLDDRPKYYGFAPFRTALG
jgi:hypothetical protein